MLKPAQVQRSDKLEFASPEPSDASEGDQATLASTTNSRAVFAIWGAIVVLISLPFMQIGTLNIGFSLKFYELAIVLWVALAFFTARLVIFDRKIFIFGAVFLGYALYALAFILLVERDIGRYSDLARFSPFMDGALKSGYVLLCLFGFNLVAYATAIAPERVLRAWLWGAAAAAVIHLALFAITFVGYPVPILPGMIPGPPNREFVTLHGVSVFRAGTFNEGNTAGPYFVLSFLLAISARRLGLAGLFLAATVATFSTVAFGALAVAFGFVLVVDRKRFAVYLAIGTALAGIFLFSGVWETFVLSKLGDTASNSSIVERRQSAAEALGLVKEHPLLGVGLSQYGLHAQGWQEWMNTGGSAVSSKERLKAIANNNYMELASEVGAVGVALFLAFLVPILWLGMKSASAPVQAGIVAMFVIWMAAPTFTTMYYWAYFGISCGLARHAMSSGTKSPQSTM
jgi:O-antigen ligase